jgi:hypothetical protein
MENTETNTAREPIMPKKKRTIPPEQLEKMRLGRIQKAKERKEAREQSRILQKQAIEQQKERIELLNITKKKKAEIKRRLAEVKRGETQIEEVEEIIEQYDGTPNSDSTSANEEPLEDSDGENVLRLEVEEAEEEILKEKVKALKQKEDIKREKLETETLDFQQYYKDAVDSIMKKIPPSARKHFKDQTDNYDPKLDVQKNIENMIENIQTKINKNVESVKTVKDTIDLIHDEMPKPDLETKKTETELRKKVVENKLDMLYKLR